VKWLLIYTKKCCFLMESRTIRDLVVRVSAHSDLHRCKHILVQLKIKAFIQSKNVPIG